MKQWLKIYWMELASKYMDNLTMNNYWEEIYTNYNAKNRHYHNITHLYNMFLQLEENKENIIDLDSLKFAIWYHDIIYKSSKKDNEEKSALFAKKHLTALNQDTKKVDTIEKLIRSTKKHLVTLTTNTDNAYLLDLDLSILGSNWETYKKYTKNIRKEYKTYPDFMYKPGRKKVLHHFLERDTLYFTNTFKNKYEEQARLNIKKEILLL